eukprot:scaffold16421_cov51-Attheya_sp.AAC.6
MFDDFIHLFVFGVPVFHVVGTEGVLEPESALVEECEGNHGLGNANALATEDTAESEFGRVTADLLDGFHDTDALALDGIGLHNDFEPAEGVGDKDINGRDDGRCHKAGGGASQA